MCKIFAMTSVEHVKLTADFLGIVRDAVCKTADKDGFGYAVSTKDGQLWGERTISPLQFDALKPQKKLTKTLALPIVEGMYSNAFGPVGADENAAFLAHGRMSTNTVSIENTHPFVSENAALIHNGVVQDAGDVVTKSLKTNCDSEILLRLWDFGGIDAIEDNASGYYAIALLDKHGQLHIVRDDRANLFVAWSETAQSFIIATTTEIIEDVAKRMHWELDAPQFIRDNTYAIFQGNDVIFHQEIIPLGYYRGGMDEGMVARSLGESEDNHGLACRYEYINSDDCPNDDEYEYQDIHSLMQRRWR